MATTLAEMLHVTLSLNTCAELSDTVLKYQLLSYIPEAHYNDQLACFVTNDITPTHAFHILIHALLLYLIRSN